jgi:hypothetical protein
MLIQPFNSLEDLHLEVNVARRLRLAAIAHIYLILPYITRYNCLLARTARSRDSSDLRYKP